MSDRTEFLDPQFEPGEFDRVERQLRTELARDTARVRPTERLHAILHEANEAGPVTATGGSGPRRWLVPVAAAAAVAAIIGGVWWSGQQDRTGTTPPASSGPSVQPTTGPSGATSNPTSGTSSPSSSSTSGPAATQSALLPVYFVGPQGDPAPTYKLFREFLRHDVPVNADLATRVKLALTEAIDAQRFTNTDGYLQPWSGQTIGDVEVTDDAISVDLASAGNPQAAVTAEIRRLAVQELVWTAQAAAQKTVPVRFTVQGGSAELFGSIPTTGTFTRPPADRAYEDLAPLWVTSPTRDQVLSASKAVTVTGSAIVFEATVTWELDRGATQVKKGHTMASVGAPMQGTYSIALGTLAPGTYTIRVVELSQADGEQVHAEASRIFTVR
jgi:hypothetical protein